MTSAEAGPPDEFIEILSGLLTSVDTRLDDGGSRAAERIVLDTLAVSLGALGHPAARVAQRYAALHPAAEGASVWGTGLRATPEIATLVNGVPLRGYDYNDLYIGAATGGHPSDVVPGLIAIAEVTGSSGPELLVSIALAYEVILELFDTVPMKLGGWDYVNLTAVGATCALARLMKLDATETRAALSITMSSHMASNEVESSELNSRGDLTMWKRFNGSNAVKQAIFACTLARCGAEGIVRPFTGKLGFIGRLNVDADQVVASLQSSLGRSRPLGRVGETTFKRWPVGSRAQCAIKAALEASSKVERRHEVRHLTVHVDPDAYHHLVAVRQDPWRPTTRETADHSLPYIVAAAFLDGTLGVNSFDPARVLDPAITGFLKNKMHVHATQFEVGGAKGGFPCRIEVETDDAELVITEVLSPPGHPRNRFNDDDFEEKFMSNVGPILGDERAASLMDAVWRLHGEADVRQLTERLLAPPPTV